MLSLARLSAESPDEAARIAYWDSLACLEPPFLPAELLKITYSKDMTLTGVWLHDRIEIVNEKGLSVP